jgi:transcriptional regulator with XRE-family HTH domain
MTEPQIEIDQLTLGEYIRALRSASALYRSGRKFAQAIGKTGSWVSKVERGREQPGTETLILIAGLLNTDPAILMEKAGRVDPEVMSDLPRLYTKKVALLKKINKMTADQLAKLDKSADTIIQDTS